MGESVPKYKNPRAPIEERIQDLLSRMTLREKVRQMDMYIGADLVDKRHPQQQTVAAEDACILWDKVEREIGKEGIGCIHDLYGSAKLNNQLQKYAVENTRLGIPILFSEEALHGLGRPGCTVFPQNITLAATWDPEIVEEVGRAIAAETRSFNIHEAFAPVIDLARDPRWGRMEETYGEDTYLSSRMAVAMVRGMQGEDLSSPDSIVAEPKHFAGYGVPTGGLNCAPALIGPRELFTYHLPVFEAAFVEGGALNTMCSYNSIDGIPCSGDRHLLTDVLRGQWKMQGFVRADLGALGNLYHWHRVTPSPEEAIKQSVEAGLDMQYYDYPHDFFQDSLIKMIQDGRMEEETINRAVARILRVKFLLGLFDNPYVDPERSKRVVRCQRHQQISLQAAREGICLLKNDGNLLPLKKTVSSIAVIGPNADEARLGDYTPVIEGFETVTVLEGIKRLASPQTTVTYVRGTGITAREMVPVPGSWLKTDQGEAGLTGEYFDNPDCDGEPDQVRTDSQIDFNWMLTKPLDGIRTTGFSVRWSGKLVPQQSFSGYLGTETFDSMRVWIDGELAIDGWGSGKEGSQRVRFDFEAGREYDLRVEYRKDAGGARIMLGWSFGEEEIQKAAEAAAQADVAVVVLGDSNQTCGEGLDRVDLDLPGQQKKLLKAVYDTGTPVVLVLQNGRALTLSWEAAHIPAIVEAWYGGEKGGLAIAEVIFGEVNPSGRLPVSFPKAVGQVPVYYNRQPGGSRRYIEMDWEPLFPFGYGLSYTEFEYGNLKVSPDRIGADGQVTVTFEVTNVGDRAGDEVVQLYLRDLWSSVVRPHRELKRFKRIHLKPKETKTVTFTLGPKDLQLLDRNFNWVVEPGPFEVMVGPNSSQLELKERFEVV